MKDGSTISEEINVADAHPAGARPFERKQYIEKFKTLTQGIISKRESDRFLKIAQNLKNLQPGELKKLNIEVNKRLKKPKKSKRSIF